MKTTDPLAGWSECTHRGCPLADHEAVQPDDMDDIYDSGVAHGVQHINIGDVWLTAENAQSSSSMFAVIEHEEPGRESDEPRVVLCSDAAEAWDHQAIRTATARHNGWRVTYKVYELTEVNG